jgi:hypothetical protein
MQLWIAPERVGGMDYFFYNAKCKQNNVEVHWFFPIDLSMENMGIWQFWQ